MKANELPINTFLQAANVPFVIPVYQRKSNWSSNACMELLDDIGAVETTCCSLNRMGTLNKKVNVNIL